MSQIQDLTDERPATQVRENPSIPSYPLLVFSPRKIAGILTVVLLFLVFVYSTSQLIRYFTGHDFQFGLLHLFNLDEENNIPTWFSSLLLSLCALLAALIGLRHKCLAYPFAIHWLALAAIFLCMSLDETASIHNMANGPLQKALHLGEPGFFHETWVVLGGLFVLIVGASYYKFMIALPLETRQRFILAAGIYVGGAVGLEMIRGNTYPYDHSTLTDFLGGLCEESLEMLGLVICVYALSSYLSSQIGELHILFREETPQDFHNRPSTMEKRHREAPKAA